jgi:hypothetical protein
MTIRTQGPKKSSGESDLGSFNLTPEQHRYFCKHRGSPVKSENINQPDEIRVRIGTVASDTLEHSDAQILAASKAHRDEICGDPPQYESYEPGS